MRKLGILAACLLSVAAMAGVAIYEDGVWQSGFPGSLGYRVYEDGVFQDPDATSAAAAGVTTQAYASTVGIWMPIDMVSDVDPLADYSAVGTNTAAHGGTPTYQTNSGTIAGWYDLDGSADLFGGSDKDVWSMNSGGSDVAFTMYAWVNPDVLQANKSIITKYNFNDTQREYQLRTAGANDRYLIMLHDESSGGNIFAASPDGDQVAGVWTMVAASYLPNSGAVDGLNLYLNSELSNGSRGTNSTYAAMENGTAPINLGSEGTGGDYWNGGISHAFIWKGTNLTASEISAEFQRTATNFGWLDGIDVNIASGDEFLTNGLVLASSYEYAAAADQSGNGYHGTVNGATHTVDGSGNFASYDFDGLNDEIQYADSSDFSFISGGQDSAFTVSAWVYLDSLSSNQRIVAKWKGSNVEYIFNYGSGSTNFYCTLRKQTGVYTAINVSSTAGSVSTGQWYNVVWTYDGSESETGLNLYVNGALDSAAQSENGTYDGMIDGTGKLMIGNSTELSASPFNGKIDDVRIYKGVEWSAAQVLTAYQTSTNQVAR